MNRVVVVGAPGCGKTTTARAIATALGLPHTELDSLWWEPDWVEAGAEVFGERVRTVVEQPRWVVDGNYFSVGAREAIWSVADTIVWLTFHDGSPYLGCCDEPWRGLCGRRSCGTAIASGYRRCYGRARSCISRGPLGQNTASATANCSRPASSTNSAGFDCLSRPIRGSWCRDSPRSCIRRLGQSEPSRAKGVGADRYGAPVTAGAPSPRPWLVMVTGEPGSGKSTLGRAIAGALRIPYLSRDDVRWGLYATAGLWTNHMRPAQQRDDAVEAFLQVVEKTAGLGVSAVLEFIVFRDRPESLARLEKVADCFVVFAVAGEAGSRADRRDLADPLLNRRSVLDALGHGSVESYTEGRGREIVRAGMRTDFNLPLLTVRTDDGYDPPLAQVVDWVINQTRER